MGGVDDEGWEARMAARARDRAVPAGQRVSTVREGYPQDEPKPPAYPPGIYSRTWRWREGEIWEPVAADRCWKCHRERPDLAHAVYEYVAALLSVRLVRAYDEHEASCEWCRRERDGGWFGPMSGPCPERTALSDLLPAGYLPVAFA